MSSVTTCGLSASYHERLFPVVSAFEQAPQKDRALQILELIAPQDEVKTLAKDRIHDEDALSKTLRKLLKQLKDESKPFSLQDAEGALQSYAPSLDHLLKYFKELKNPAYSEKAIREYLTWYLHLTLAKHSGRAYGTKERTQKLQSKILSGDYEVADVSNNNGITAFNLQDRETGQCFARVKQNRYHIFSSYKDDRNIVEGGVLKTKSIIPDMPLSATTTEHELIGYEIDQLFGFSNTPTSLGARFINADGKEVAGVIQEFIPNGSGGFDLINPEGADLLLALPSHHVHMLVLSGLFKGLSAHHLNNYHLQRSGDLATDAIKKIWEIDLEECLLPYNRLDGVEGIRLDDDFMPHKEQALKMIILCRMWVLGLPQNDQPFDRALLMAMAHPDMVNLLEEYQRSASGYSRMDPESWQAQMARVKEMQRLCIEELTKTEMTLTPRDLYFEIFGGRHLYEHAQKMNLPDFSVFNNFVADPYRYYLKTFSQQDLDNLAPWECTQRSGETDEMFVRRRTFYEKMRQTP